MNGCSNIPFDVLWPPLKTSKSIRVFEIVDSVKDSILEVKLHNTTVDSTDYPYCAISYAWGKSLASEWLEIRCNDQKLPVTPTLHSALSRIKDNLKKPFYWVDALCINQSSERAALEERAAQVQMMDRIFNSAALVIVDLGLTTPEDIPMLNRVATTFSRIETKVWEEILSSPAIDQYDSTYKHLDLPSMKDHNFWSQFLAFVSRPYFTRIWVVQEIVLAREAILMIGSNFRDVIFLDICVHRPLRYLWRLWLYGTSPTAEWHYDNLLRKENMKKVAVVMNAVSGLMNLRNTYYNGEKIFDFATLLLLTQNLEASDPRDKAYALRGMAKDEDIQDLKVDYRAADESECACRVSKYLISQNQGVWMLYNCCGITTQGKSWAYNFNPRFKTGSYDEFSGHVSPYQTVSVYNACGDFQSNLRLRGDYLVVSGFRLGFVGDLTSKMPIEEMSHLNAKDRFPALEAWWQEVEAWILAHHSAVQDDLPLVQFREKCWDVVTTDRFRQGDKYVRLHDAPATLDSSRAAFLQLVEYVRIHKTVLNVQYTTMFLKCREFFYSTILAANKRLAVVCCETNNSRSLCIVPAQTIPGDQLVILGGCPIPFSLRKDGVTDEYRIVGLCYVDGMMDGQVVNSSDYELQDIVLC